MSRRRERYRPNYSGLAYAGGGSIANIGADLIKGGLAQDAKNAAFELEKKRSEAIKQNSETTKNYFELNDKKYKDSKLDLEKKESREEAEKKSNIDSTRKYLEGLKIDTKDMSDEDIFYNGQRIENIHKDITDRKYGTTYSTPTGLVTKFLDSNGNVKFRMDYSNPPEVGSKEAEFREWSEDKIQIPADRVSEWDSDIETYDDKGKGYWVSKKAFAKREKELAKAKEALGDEL